MPVSNSFQELNSLRPADARFGEVTCIHLFVTDVYGQTTSVEWSKRKSVHVPPSSNAYWNWMCLRAGLVRWCSERGITRRQRLALYESLNQAVRETHKISLMQTYAEGGETVVQYFDIHLRMCIDDLPTEPIQWVWADANFSETPDESPLFAAVHYV